MIETKTYPVIEIFGPTIQGEGAMAGKVTNFIRMGGCDYRCAWCDSGYAVLPEQVREHAAKLSAGTIVDNVRDLAGDSLWVTISGGNPALHDLAPVVSGLHGMGKKVAVETQGTLWKDWLGQVDQLTISPKPPSSKMTNTIATDKFMYKALTTTLPLHKIALKVPVQDDADYEFAVATHRAYPEIPFYFSVVTLMGGLDGRYRRGEIDTSITLLDRYRWLAELVAADPRVRDTTVLPQLHALIWGHGRGF